MAEARKPYQVVRRKDITMMPELGKTAPYKAVTYQTEDLPPHTIFILASEYKPDVEDRRILDDLKARRAERV